MHAGSESMLRGHELRANQILFMRYSAPAGCTWSCSDIHRRATAVAAPWYADLGYIAPVKL